MRKITIDILTFFFLLHAAFSMKAQDRVFVSTDRDSYLAGEWVFCSLFCTDGNCRLDDFSSVAYLELISGDGTVAEAKAGLFGGRGAGGFRIPSNTPTGNYRLIAYTARSQAVPGGGPTLAVFNTTSTSRVAGGVEIVSQDAWKAPVLPADRTEEGLSLSFPARLRQGQSATLWIDAPEGADLSLSVRHEDYLVEPSGFRLSSFLSGTTAAPASRSGEYEGEIILANVEGLQGGNADSDQVTAYLSSAGDPSNVYIGRSDDSGHIRFYTDNIYGNRELVCEVVSMSGRSCHISLASPFTHPDPGAIPKLGLSPAQREALVTRKASLREEPSLLDTLAEFLPRRRDLLLSGSPSIRYHLDDYTRFDSVREICIEFVPELQFVRKDGRWRILMFVSDGTASRKYLQDNVLVLMDGVVLTDHGMLENFDAMLLEDIDIYRQAVTLGGVSYSGVVNFISKASYVTALSFPENVRVIDFPGVSYPVAYLGAAPSGRDIRQLLYWHPALEIPSGGNARIQIKTPGYSGSFRIVAEGVDGKGRPLEASWTFTVE